MKGIVTIIIMAPRGTTQFGVRVMVIHINLTHIAMRIGMGMEIVNRKDAMRPDHNDFSFPYRD